MHKDIRVSLSSAKNTNNVIVTSLMPPTSEQSYAQNLLNGSSYFVIILSFLGLGLLLAFTPCILPMIPILSSIIVGHGKNLTPLKSFFLSLTYVLGMAITYAIAGMLVAMVGSGIQVLFQKTWVIVLFSILFVILSLSLFGYYELQLPARWQRKVTALSNKQKGGTYIGVFLMGALSSLIVSPCVSAPLVGVLAYIAQTGNMVLGGVALLCLGLGMGVPLLLIGLSAGKLLPKAGAWMEAIKKVFGILLLAVAVEMLSRVIPGPFTLVLWATLLICVSMFMGTFVSAKNNFKKLLRGFGAVFLIYGIILVIGAVMGNSDPLHPWEEMKFLQTKPKDSLFVTLGSMEQLDAELARAKKDHKMVMLDFYADWCTSCVAMDRAVFKNGNVQQALNGLVLLRADVTKNDEFAQSLLKRFQVIAPPTMLFFDKKGEELPDERIVGEVDSQKFIEHVELVKKL
jgi:thiol:disulfide interchange protein DsbD